MPRNGLFADDGRVTDFALYARERMATIESAAAALKVRVTTAEGDIDAAEAAIAAAGAYTDAEIAQEAIDRNAAIAVVVADLAQEVSDRDAAVDAVQAQITPGSWTTVTLNSGFVHLTGNPLRVRKVGNNRVEFRGFLTVDNMAINATHNIATLASTYRPALAQYFSVPGAYGADTYTFRVLPSGGLELATGPAIAVSIAFSGVSYDTTA